MTAQTENIVPRLLALAWKLEGVGQYNNAKLARSAAEAISRRAAYQLELPADRMGLSSELKAVAVELAGIEVTAALSETMKTGAGAMSEGRLPMIVETPNPFVCRTCGHVVISDPLANCPVCAARPETFKRFLPVYWLDNLDPFEALQILRQTPGRVAQLINDLNEEEMNQSPDEGEWSVRNAISHLRDAQGVMEFRVDLMIEEDNPKLESKAVFEWAAEEADRPPGTQEIYQTYFTSRRRVIDRLENLPLKDWWRTGQHEEFGNLTIKQQVSYFASHEITHFPQIEALVYWQKGLR